MAKVKLTKNLVASWLGTPNVEIFGGTLGFGGTTGDNAISSNTPSRGNRLILCGGVPPTVAEFRNQSAPVTNNAFRLSDMLAYINYGGLYAGYADGAFNFKESPFGTAHRGGVATWFQLVAWSGSSQNLCFMIGDVSDLNGTGLIKLPTTTLAAADRVSIKPLKLIMPNEFTY